MTPEIHLSLHVSSCENYCEVSSVVLLRLIISDMEQSLNSVGVSVHLINGSDFLISFSCFF